MRGSPPGAHPVFPLLLKLDNVSLAYGSRPLLDHVALSVDEGERVCLVGRNGEGKSSLLRLLIREAQPDDGVVWIRPGARVAHVAQDITALSNERVIDVVNGGLPQIGRALEEYHRLSQHLAQESCAADTRRLTQLQHEIDAAGGWQIEQKVATVLTRLQLEGEARFDSLSGGWRRRALVARALVSEPDVLLLDEPTNHLDIEAIEWLEDFMLEYSGALLFVSHDRAFVNRLATRVVELDRGTLISMPGNYETYAKKKAQQLDIEAQHNALFDKKLAQEEVWIRKGVEARRTRNEGRVRALYALREEHRQRRERTGRVNLVAQETNESGKLVFEAEDLGFSIAGRPIIEHFSTRIMRGDRIGIVGPNGAGKSTLIKLLLGELEPTCGRLQVGSRMEVAYYDQQREQLRLDESVMENVSERNDYVTINGQPRHVSGYLRDFLFRPDQFKTPARALSGGERNRLLLARLFARPANVLVLDEPTNDLDIDTLELLEEFVAEFSGTLLLVSHDRAFLDNVVTDLLVFEAPGKVSEFVGGYSDWARYRDQRNLDARARDRASAKSATKAAPEKKARKLSYKDQRELDSMAGKIEAWEQEKSKLEIAMADASFYARPQGEVSHDIDRLAQLGLELESAYARWAELEAAKG